MWESFRESGDFYIFFWIVFYDIEGCRFSLEIGIEGKDELLRRSRSYHPIEYRCDMELVRGDSRYR
jgi:hypothetical protein